MDGSKLHIVTPTGFLEKDGKYLILKRSEKEIAFPGKWCVPGGKVERGDNMSVTLKKEFLEEAGIEIADEMEYFGEATFIRPDGYSVIMTRFICKYKSGEVKIDENDFSDFAWIGLDELDRYDLIGGVREDFEKLKTVG